MTLDAKRLRELKGAIKRVRPPTGAAREFATYLETLDRLVLIDERIARAAMAGDSDAVTIGRLQNQVNRNKRTQLAGKLRLSPCLEDASAT